MDRRSQPRYRHPLRRLVYGALDRFTPDETTTLVVVAAVLGVIGGYGAIVFRWLVQFFQGFAIGRGEDVVELLAGHPWWHTALMPVIGALIVGPLVHYGAREAKGHGVPEVINAVVFKDGVIRPIVAAVKILASAVSIAFGGSVGREGPIIQIGAAMSSAVGQWLRFSPQRLRTMIGCGAAAGIAATFNAPIAGAIFALEILLRDFAISAFSPIIVASVVATAVGRHHLGDHPAFPVPGFHIGDWMELPAYVVLGLVVGVVSVVYVKTLYWTEGRFERLRFPEPLKPLLGAVPLGLLAVAFPQIYGIGYGSMVEALNGDIVWPLMLALVAVKLVAVNLTLGSGFSGGIFAPALFLGGMMGGAFGGAVHAWVPGSPGGFAMVGMAAMVAASTRGPITAILILFEMTGEYAIILPLMLACIAATLVAQRIMPESIFTLRFAMEGRSLNYGRESAILKSWHVGDVMEMNPTTVRQSETLDAILDRFLSSPESHFYVVDDHGGLAGRISIHDIKDLINAEGLGRVVIAADICHPADHVCYRQDDLEEVLMLLTRSDEHDLPVLERPGHPVLVGVLHRKALFDVYNQEVLHKDVLGMKVVTTDTGMHDCVELPELYRVQLLTPPTEMVGSTLRELELRRRWGITVLAMKRKGWSGASYNELPDPDRRLESVDRLLVVGHVDDLDRMVLEIRAGALDEEIPS